MIFLDIMNMPFNLKDNEDYLVPKGVILLTADGSPFTWLTSKEDQITFKHFSTTVMYDPF
jgi:hypothetical protein